MRFLFVAALLVACTPTPPTAPDAEPLPPAPSDDSGVTASGRFGGLDGHTASGGVTFRVTNGGGELIFAEDFRSSRVPDPHVYVATDPDANRGTRLRIATLVSNAGAQRYAFRIPEGVRFAYVLVWCDKYNVGVGAARLGNLP